MTAMVWRAGPERSDQWWLDNTREHPGPCMDCGGECYPDHGHHPQGCRMVVTIAEEFWLYAPGCPLWHGE